MPFFHPGRTAISRISSVDVPLTWVGGWGCRTAIRLDGAGAASGSRSPTQSSMRHVACAHDNPKYFVVLWCRALIGQEKHKISSVDVPLTWVRGPRAGRRENDDLCEARECQGRSGSAVPDRHSTCDASHVPAQTQGNFQQVPLPQAASRVRSATAQAMYRMVSRLQHRGRRHALGRRPHPHLSADLHLLCCPRV